MANPFNITFPQWMKDEAYNNPDVVGRVNSQDNFYGGMFDLRRFSEKELAKWQTDPATGMIGSLQDIADRRGMEEDVAKARAEAGRSADVAEGIYSRRTEGMDLSDRQKQGAAQKLGLTREVTKAAAAYAQRRDYNERSRAASKALGLGFEDISFGQQLGGLVGLANADAQRKVNDANRRAAKKERRNNMIGTIIGLFRSSESSKDAVEKNPQLLDKLKKVRVDKWKYHGGDRDHIGPYAEEFNQTFGVGKNHQGYLDVVDVLGVALGAVKELNEKVEATKRV